MLKDHAPEKWVCKEHTRVKHELLEKYLRAWIPILGKWYSTIAYFDGFAGRGIYSDGEPGSPLIAMRLADELAPRFRRLLLHFVELDGENFANLQAAVEQERAALKHRGKIEVQLTPGDFDRTMNELLGFIEDSRASLVPSFFFIDPFGFTGVTMQTVGRILASARTEVFFTFMLRDINRFLELPQLADTMDRLFGGDYWREVLGLPDRERALVELYRRQLHNKANAKYSLHFKVCESDSAATLYYLIHSNNNPKGHQIMKSVMFNQGARGLFAYLGRNDLAARTQTRLFDVTDTGALKDELLRRFAGQTLAFDDIMEAMSHPWFEEPPYIGKHYREVIKQMERDGIACILPVTSKTDRGLQGRDRVTFGNVAS